MTGQVFPGRGGKKRKNTFGAARGARYENVEPLPGGFAGSGNGDGVVGDDALVGGCADKVKATGERCRGRVMTTQRVVNAFMSRVAL